MSRLRFMYLTFAVPITIGAISFRVNAFLFRCIVSSYVNFLVVELCGGAWPVVSVFPGVMTSRFVPTPNNSCDTYCLVPSPRDTRRITDATPITTPNMVRKEHQLSSSYLSVKGRG